MSADRDQKALLHALKVLNWRAAGAAKFVQTTPAEELAGDFLDELRLSCRDAAERTEDAFHRVLGSAPAPRQTRITDFVARSDGEAVAHGL